MNRALKYGLIAALGAAGLMVFLLAASASNTAFFSAHYNSLLYANFAVAGLVALAVFSLLWRLVRRRIQGRFGSRLTIRFATAFALMGIVPGIVMFLLSATFLQRSIDSWFNVRVDAALESGLMLTRTTLDALLADTTFRTRAIAQELAEIPDALLPAQVSRAREAAGLSELTIFMGPRILAFSSAETLNLKPELPNTSQLRQLKTAGTLSILESEGENRLRMRVIVPIVAAQKFELNPQLRFVQVLQPVPVQLAKNAETVRAGYQDYTELSLSRSGLRKMYGLTLILALLLAVLASVTASFFLANSMTAPLLKLAEGTKAVAEGDYRPLALHSTETKPEQHKQAIDELDTLMVSFNAMTAQLSEARLATQTVQNQLKANNVFLENVLSNLSAGVLVLDHQQYLSTYNDSAVRILGHSLADQRGQLLQDTLLMDVLSEQNSFEQDHWQRQIERPRGPDQAPQTLLIRSATLPLPEGMGRVVVFDDISELITAQRSVAWAEVAQRLAHEIKNPLTPIQLSAERLEHKLTEKLNSDDAAMLAKSCATIINQVTALKRLVNEFRDYARLPQARLEPLDLNALIEEIMRLYESDLIAGGRIALCLAKDLPLIQGDASQLRQVIHNLLKNALEASEHINIFPTVTLSTWLAIDAENARKRVKFTVTDNGCGFPAKILGRAFEPYATTKAGGTGLGLAIVKRIIDEHGARITLSNREAGGAQVEITFSKLAQSFSGALNHGQLSSSQYIADSEKRQ
ncbi:MAG: HAMP domain-containing protein [Burkholderiaceae bacterium]|nr:HAMP domain-containing protein [Burkholderiaceae bacterium]